MDDAGCAIYSAIVEEFSDVYGRRLLVLAGTGNNGGDAIVAGRRAHTAGGGLRIVLGCT